jgi:ATP-dependent Clp protease ATP-binding subunit ClpA
MFERFTDQARRVVVGAQQECLRLGHDQIGPEHVLLAMLDQPAAMGTVLLTSFGADAGALHERLERAIGQGGQPLDRSGHIPFDPKAKQLLELALREALQLGDAHIGTEHLLLAAFRVEDSPAAEALAGTGVSLSAARLRVGETPTTETVKHGPHRAAIEANPRLVSLRAAKDAALDRGDFEAAAVLRAQERELLRRLYEGAAE